MRRGRNFYIYIVQKVGNPLPLTYVNSYAEGFEYINRLIFLDKREHFVNWCRLNNLDYNEDDIVNWSECWLKYVRTCLDEEDYSGYTIAKLKCNTLGIAEILRYADGCTPLGCSYESVQECDMFKNYVLKKDEQSEEDEQEVDDYNL